MSFKNTLPALMLGVMTACSAPSEDVVRRESGEGSDESPVRTAPGSVASPDPEAADPAEGSRTVVFLGTSLTAGYGLDDPADGYPARVQARIDEAGLPFTVVNAGVSGDTSRGGLERIAWVLQSSPEVLVVELGANDGLRGIEPETMRENLQAIVDRAREARPDVRIVVAGMEAPPNMGVDFATKFRTVFVDLADANDALLIPFLLDGVAGMPELNQADGIHPTPEGHARMAETVWQTLGPLLTNLAG